MRDELCETFVAAGMAGCVSTVYLSRCQHISLKKQVTQLSGKERQDHNNGSKCEQIGKNWPMRIDSDAKAIRHLPAAAEEGTSMELSKRTRSKSKSEKCFQTYLASSSLNNANQNLQAQHD